MSGRAIFRIGACLALILALGACEKTKQALGRTKSAPDEFAVFKRAPLSVPPDYQLRPPSPGAERPQSVNPRDRVRQTVTGREEAGVGPVANQAASPTVAGASPGEIAVLKASGALNADPDIRRAVNLETYKLGENQRSFTEKVVFWQDPIPTGIAVDPVKESKRLREAQAMGKPLNDGDVPTIVRKRKGILEDLLK